MDRDRTQRTTRTSTTVAGLACIVSATLLMACSEPRRDPEPASADPAPAAAVAVEPADAAPGATGSADAGTPGQDYIVVRQGSGSRAPDSRPLADDMPRPAEQRFLQGPAIGPGAHALLSSKEFDAVVNQLARDSGAVGLRQTGLYRAAIEETLLGLKVGNPVERLECGATLCLASLSETRGQPWFEGWWQDLPDNLQAPVYALIYVPVERPDGGTDYRVLFTTSPRYRAIAGAPPPPGG